MLNTIKFVNNDVMLLGSVEFIFYLFLGICLINLKFRTLIII